MAELNFITQSQNIFKKKITLINLNFNLDIFLLQKRFTIIITEL